MNRIARFTAVMLVGVVLCMSLGAFIVAMRHQETLRDVRRLTDMRRAEFAFTRLVGETGSFAAAAKGCPHKDSLLASCDFSVVQLDLAVLEDPGRFAYRIQEVPSHTGYAVGFMLERKHGSLAAGAHTLTQQGIR